MSISPLAQVIWQAPWLAPVALGMVSATVAAVLWLYPPQIRRLAARWRWMLPLLRGLAVAAIAAAVVQPIVLRPRTTAREGAIVILADQSHSMSVVDRDRTPAQLVALAAGLGALAPDQRPEPAPGLWAHFDAIEGLVDQVARARSEAEYARLSGHGAPAANVRLRDLVARLGAALREVPVPPAGSGAALSKQASAVKRLAARPDDAALGAIHKALAGASEALAAAQAQSDARLFAARADVRSICTRLARLPREALLELGLTQQLAGVLPNLPAGVPVYGYGFGDAGDLRPITQMVAGQTGSLNLQPSGDGSDLAAAVRNVLRRMGNRGIQAMIVLSDGREVGGSAEGIEGALPAPGIPVFTVEAAAGGVPRDIAITGFDVPVTARAGQTILARVTIRETGFRGEPIEVRLEGADQTMLTSVTPVDDPSQAASGAQIATAEFELALPHGGAQALTASVLPRDGEITDENNRRTRWIRVGAEPARVLVIAGPDAGRQYVSLHATLSRTPWVRLREVEEDEADTLSPSDILTQDVIVLCDVPLGQLASTQWSAVEQSAQQRGSAVVVCAGRDAPSGYAADPAARRLLPFDPAAAPQWQNWPGGEPGFRLRGSNDLTDEAEFLRHLEPVSSILPLSPLRSNSQVLLFDRASGQPVLTRTPDGIGNIYFLGTDQSWRWRGPRGGKVDRDAFWPQLMALAAPQPYPAGSGSLWLDADEIAPQPQSAIDIRARIFDADQEPESTATQTAHVLQDGQPVRDVTLHSLADGSGCYEGTIGSGLPAGDYELRLDPPPDWNGDFLPDPVFLSLHVARSYESEMEDVGADEHLLRRIADASGGQFIPLDQFNTLPRRLTEVRQRQSRLVEYPLWDSPYLFAFVLACLSAEWALRKRFALA